ncbi:MAG: aspartate--tRNA ligase [Bacteroidia bacterium]
MLRTHTCGELTIASAGQHVTLCGWVQRSREMGGMIFVDIRDRYGITQLVFNMEVNKELCMEALKLGREFVIQAKGKVAERSNKNLKLPTGEIEIIVDDLKILNAAKTPPFTIEDNTDGGDDLRMKYRYLDIRRNPVQQNIFLRHKMAQETRKYLDSKGFIEIETPVLIKSTPEGARDFVVPSRMNPGEFYALPQSPQTFKQLLMVACMDKYFQIVKCFRDEDLRADRQPEFTQIDCEMSFIEREDILQMFEGMVRHLFKNVKGIELPALPRMTYDDAMKYYGNDKPDIRFEMKISELNDVLKGKGFKVFDDSELVVGICVPGCSEYTRKQLDELTDFVKRPQIGANGMVYAKCNNDGTIKSSVDKFYNEDELKKWKALINAQNGDLILILAGEKNKTRKAMSELRLEMGNRCGLRNKDTYAVLWVTDFPLLEWNEERFYAKHHPFTSPDEEGISIVGQIFKDLSFTNEETGNDPNAKNMGIFYEKYKFILENIKANAYDMVINGVEVGGGSIRIHDKTLQQKMFSILGFSEEEAQAQFGFLMNAFEYGAPPHGGIAFGFDRLCSLFGGTEFIRDFIAFPKNNSGRDVMIDSPSAISAEQLKELDISVNKK